jgi:pimeloyl-ACP methyl ester carboxylesterase
VALGDWSSPATKEFLKQVSQADADFLRWATRAVLTWRVSAPPTNIPICHIHGDRDLVLPIGQAKPDRVVAGAGHVLSLSHPRQVNAYLEECMRRYGV